MRTFPEKPISEISQKLAFFFKAGYYFKKPA
jgi:hypothetical protein